MKEPDASEYEQAEGKDDFPLDHVASIAARLLEGDRYAEAADRAILLLDACRAKLSTRQRRAALLSRAHAERKAWWDKYVPTVDGKTYMMPWREALTHITGQRKEDRAQPRFVKFYAFFWQDCDATAKSVPFELADPPTAKEITDRLKRFKAEGINSHRAGTLKAAYEGWSRLDAIARAQGRARAREKKKATMKRSAVKDSV